MAAWRLRWRPRVRRDPPGAPAGGWGPLAHTSASFFLQRRQRCCCRRAFSGMSCRGRCVRATCGCRCSRGPPAAPSPACREPPAARCCCSSWCWPTLCGTASWRMRDPGIGVSLFWLAVFLLCLAVCIRPNKNCCFFVWQPTTCVSVCFAEWRDGGRGRAHLSACVPSLPARLHAVQNEPQQGASRTGDLTFVPTKEDKSGAKYFWGFFCLCVCGC